MDAATKAVAAAKGAFDVNIAIQRLPSLRKMRATVTPLPIECQFDYVRGNPFARNLFPAFSLHNNS